MPLVSLPDKAGDRFVTESKLREKGFLFRKYRNQNVQEIKTTGQNGANMTTWPLGKNVINDKVYWIQVVYNMLKVIN